MKEEGEVAPRGNIKTTLGHPADSREAKKGEEDWWGDDHAEGPEPEGIGRTGWVVGILGRIQETP